MRKFAPVVVLAAACGLAGCWQSKTSLYGDQAGLEPFQAGRVEGSNVKDSDKEQALLSKEANGVYRLTNDVKGSSDFGDSFTVRFFPLAGAPPRIVVFEALERKDCKPGDNLCNPADTEIYYGLARIEAHGASMINPDCPKGGAVTKLPGVTADDYVCNFSDRASLEKALLALSHKAWKPDVTYRFE